MKKYIINSSISILRKQIEQYSPEFILYRDKQNQDYDKDAQEFINICAEFKNIKTFIHQKPNLAKKIGASGAHLTSLQFDKIKVAKDLGLEVIISTHTKEEVLLAQKDGADAVTYSPIFNTPDKGKPKGIDNLKELLSTCSIPVFALGGVIEPLHVELLEQTGVYGFASIRYFT